MRYRLVSQSIEYRYELIQITYLKSLNDQGIFVVEACGNLFTVDCTNVLLYIPSNNHDLPLAAVLGNTTIFGASLTSGL